VVPFSVTESTFDGLSVTPPALSKAIPRRSILSVGAKPEIVLPGRAVPSIS